MAYSFPLSTMQVAELLSCPEHSVRNQIRLAKIRPQIIVGRRAWTPAEVLRCANTLGRDSVEVREICRKAQEGQQ